MTAYQTVADVQLGILDRQVLADCTRSASWQKAAIRLRVKRRPYAQHRQHLLDVGLF